MLDNIQAMRTVRAFTGYYSRNAWNETRHNGHHAKIFCDQRSLDSHVIKNRVMGSSWYIEIVPALQIATMTETRYVFEWTAVFTKSFNGILKIAKSISTASALSDIEREVSKATNMCVVRSTEFPMFFDSLSNKHPNYKADINNLHFSDRRSCGFGRMKREPSAPDIVYWVSPDKSYNDGEWLLDEIMAIPQINEDWFNTKNRRSQ